MADLHFLTGNMELFSQRLGGDHTSALEAFKTALLNDVEATAEYWVSSYADESRGMMRGELDDISRRFMELIEELRVQMVTDTQRTEEFGATGQ